MTGHILDYLEQNGAAAQSRSQQEQLEAGIRLFLLENGIGEEERRPYFFRYVDRCLREIRCADLRAYFCLYPVISRVHQIAIEFRADGGIPDDQKKELYRCMEALFSGGLGGRYVPAVEVQEILGPWA